MSRLKKENKFTWRLIIFTVIGVGVLLYLYFPNKPIISSLNSNPPTLKKITIAQFGDVFLYAPLYIAKDIGIFSNHGLDVSIVSTGGDEKTWAAVISGSAAFGVADPTFVVVSAERGQPGKVIASIVSGAPFWGVTYDQSIPEINDAHQLQNYTVATFPAPSTAYTLQKKMFLDAGLEPKIREGAFGSLLAMIKTKQADIALELEPNVSQSVSDGAKVVYGLDKIYGDFLITGLTALPESLTKNPNLAHDVACSLDEATKYIAENKSQAAKLLIKRFPEIKESDAVSALERMTASHIIPMNAKIGETGWEKAIKLRQSVGDIKSEGSFKMYVDNSFAESCSKNNSN